MSGARYQPARSLIPNSAGTRACRCREVVEDASGLDPAAGRRRVASSADNRPATCGCPSSTIRISRTPRSTSSGQGGSDTLLDPDPGVRAARGASLELTTTPLRHGLSVRPCGRQSITSAAPPAERAKKSGACEHDLPSGVVHNSQNGWAAMPTTSGSKSSSISQSRSSHDSYPTRNPVVHTRQGIRSWPSTSGRHDCAAPCRTETPRTGKHSSNGTDHASISARRRATDSAST